MADSVMKALFLQQRIQILHMGINHNAFDIGYIYAWEEGIYPIASDRDDSVVALPHQVYPDHFLVTRSEVDKIVSYLDDKWISGHSPTFDDFHSVFSYLDRYTLIKVCRYFHINGMFDDKLWSALLTPQHFPSVAKSITKSLTREQMSEYF